MPDFPDTNYSLIDRVKDIDDSVSWLEFLGIYQPLVYRMARRRGLQDADAQDVMQQVFASIVRSISRWKASPDQPPFRAWLTTIARNAITTSLSRRPRDRATGSSSVAELLEKVPGRQHAESEVAAEMRQEIVRWSADQIRGEFTNQTWSIFLKTAIEGTTVAEIARETGKTPGAIYVARHRVLMRLKDKVAEVSKLWESDEDRYHD